MYIYIYYIYNSGVYSLPICRISSMAGATDSEVASPRIGAGDRISISWWKGSSPFGHSHKMTVRPMCNHGFWNNNFFWKTMKNIFLVRKVLDSVRKKCSPATQWRPSNGRVRSREFHRMVAQLEANDKEMKRLLKDGGFASWSYGDPRSFWWSLVGLTHQQWGFVMAHMALTT